MILIKSAISNTSKKIIYISLTDENYDDIECSDMWHDVRRTKVV